MKCTQEPAISNWQLAISQTKQNQRQQMTPDGRRHAAHWSIARSRGIAEIGKQTL